MFNNYEISLIKRSDSRKYFEDVLQSYYSKNYRASVLLLYSLTIDDLYYKLVLMNDKHYYNLNQELEKIEQLSKNESKYSEIEDEIYLIYKEKKILNHDTLDCLEFFKKIRNKCAHPSFFKEERYNPYQEEVYMIIRRVYYDILIKEAFIKDPYELMKSDIENKDWGNITDILIGFEKHEDNYAVFSVYFIEKYFEKFTDNNFLKLFNTLVKLIILKNEEWSRINQYKNMLLMESMINYLSSKGKINILYNVYDWSKITEENLIDDNDVQIYNREWFALTNMYKILDLVPKFKEEIKNQNDVSYKFLKEKLLQRSEYIIEYWQIFYNTFNELLENIKNREFSFYLNLLNNASYLEKEIKIKVLKMLFEKVPTFNGFNEADKACDILINIATKENLNNNDINEILNLMNNNSQIYSKSRNNSCQQMRTINRIGIDLDEYYNLKVLLGE